MFKRNQKLTLKADASGAGPLGRRAEVDGRCSLPERARDAFVRPECHPRSSRGAGELSVCS